MIRFEKYYKDWIAYERVRREGNYNMLLEGKQAAEEAGLTLGKYTEILKKYPLVKAELERINGFGEGELNKIEVKDLETILPSLEEIKALKKEA